MTLPVIPGSEFARRMHIVSELRRVGICLRAAARDAYRAGRIPFKPCEDVRSDPEYWRKLREERISGEGPPAKT